MDTAGVAKAAQLVTNQIESKSIKQREEIASQKQAARREVVASEAQYKQAHSMVIENSSEIVDKASFEKVVGEQFAKIVGQGSVFPFDKTFFDKYYDYLKESVAADDAVGTRLREIAAKYISTDETDAAIENAAEKVAQPIDKMI